MSHAGQGNQLFGVGVDGLPVQVEVDLAQGLPSFSTVGLAEGAVREAKDRVRAAIKNSGYEFPQRRITVNLAPAAVKKEGTGYDLPIALGILAAAGILQSSLLEQTAITGELSLDGSVRPVPGVLPMALAARQEGISRFLVPEANAAEAAIVQGLEVFGIERLDQAVEFLAGGLNSPRWPSIRPSCLPGTTTIRSILPMSRARNMPSGPWRLLLLADTICCSAAFREPAKR